MIENSLSDIRKEFLDFFSKRKHNVVQSSPLVPHNDDSLLFTNAGMVQFKNIFTGLDKPENGNRAVTAQKCVRAGGKHNDLENVGLTKRHHTFFEMLGNFSFGDYFKEDAIEMAWELLTKNYQIDREKLYVTVYHTDDEAFNIWKKVTGFSESKILKISTSDNFWEMGDSGPCGPCSEIFFDHGPEFSGGLPGSEDEGDRYVEIWNLVFMQFNKKKNGDMEKLPKPSIDTGMGIERVAAVLQGTSDNYEVDTFRNIIEFTKEQFKIEENEHTKIPLRIISDHLRSVGFLISDGVLPSNEGRGYVLRRILRRAIRHIYNLNIKTENFYKLVPILIKEMGKHYKELNVYSDLINNTIKTEESKFLETLDKGLKILQEENDKNKESKIFSGKVAFKLYDTYGFPLDLTEDVLKENNKKVDISDFNIEMEKQKEMSKKSWKGDNDNENQIFWHKIIQEIKPTTFIGYDTLESTEYVSKIIINGEEVEQASDQDNNISLLFEKSPFYAESGGQIGDRGIIENSSFKFKVIDTIKRGEKVFDHYGHLISGTIKKKDQVILKVDQELRKSVAANHSATHLLHSALRINLGKHVTQKGSLVNETKLRFDISHNSSISEDLIKKIEKDINQQIFNNTQVSHSVINKEEAINKGAMAIFGEKYGDKVRVIEMGKRKEKPYSVELCGGTHVSRTGDIGLIKIISEGSLASGVRRIEAVSGLVAIEKYNKIESDMNNLALKLKTTPKLLEDKVIKILNEKKDLEKKLLQINNNRNDKSDNFEIKKIKNINVIHAILENVSSKEMKLIIDKQLKKQSDSLVILISKEKEKVTAVIGIEKNISDTFDANDLIKLIIPVLGGKGGGGRNTLAQGGGSSPENSEKAVKILMEEIERKLAS